jgi:uncharacterized damage-inducible protein DinB
MAKQEAWLRGPVAGVAPLLQPVAHALIQAREEVHAIVEALPDEALWDRPAGMASAGFHLQHLCGVLDRLLTYARGEALSGAQLTALSLEGSALPTPVTARALGHAFDARVEAALIQLRGTPSASLTEARAVGRSQLPSTVIGLLTHAAEHTMRHVGQLLVTSRVVAAGHESTMRH